MKTFLAALTTFLFCIAPSISQAKLNAFACEPEWAALITELGGKKIGVYQATSPLQDPHRIEARPSLIARMRRADLVVCSGADLEIGWLPVLIRSAGNKKVQPGQPGYFMASDFVQRLDVPVTVDRSMGDVHAKGNPHVHLDPRNIGVIANALATRLREIDPDNAKYYVDRYNDFASRWKQANVRWEEEGAGLKGLKIVTYHTDATYLAHWLGMNMTMTIEPKPGIPPSAGHLAQLLSALKVETADLIVRMAYNEPKAPEWLSERTGLTVVVLPFTVGGTKQAKDLFGLFDDTVARLRKSAGR